MQALMEQDQKQIDSFRSVNQEDERILEMYSRGESYEVIQENLLIEYGENYTGKKLGQKMGEIKKKMNCATQFQMGYLYGRREANYQCKEKIYRTNKKVSEIKTKAYDSGYLKGREDQNSFESVKSYHKGLNVGLVAASIFWLVIIGLLHQYIL